MINTSNAARYPHPKQQAQKNPFQFHFNNLIQLIPGLAATALLAWVSIWLSEYVGTALMGFKKSPISAVMMAIILGMLIGNVVTLPAALRPGLQFSMKKLLRLGIILLGIRLSVLSVFKLGALGVPVVVLCIVGALLLTTWLNRRLNLPERIGTLIAVGTSICGVTAIVAAAPAIDAEDEEVAYGVAVITVFGLVAMLTYPYLAHTVFGGEAVMAGLFLGTAIHETAQVAGAGLVYADVFGQPVALDTATITKLVRNVFMAAVIPLMAFTYARRTASTEQQAVSFRKLFPTFILGFLGFAVIRSFGDAGVDTSGYAFGVWSADTWAQVYGFIQNWAVNLMVIALAGVGLSTSFKILKGLGIKPFIVGLGAAVVVGLISLVAISALGAFVTV
ncbi:MAG: YeiH family protein [Anaerolineae bacterium]